MRETREWNLRWWCLVSSALHVVLFCILNIVNIEPSVKPESIFYVKLEDRFFEPEKLNKLKEPEVIKKQNSKEIIEVPKSKPDESQQESPKEGTDPVVKPAPLTHDELQEKSRTSSVAPAAALDPPDPLLPVSKPPSYQPPGRTLKDPPPLLSPERFAKVEEKGRATSPNGISSLGTNGKSNQPNQGAPGNSSQGSTVAEKFKNRTLPKLINPILPFFPSIGGVERCTVIVEMWVETDGRPSGITCYKEPEVDEEKKQAFIREALKVARQYRFEPALSDGKPIRIQIQIPIRFETGDAFAKVH